MLFLILKTWKLLIECQLLPKNKMQCGPLTVFLVESVKMALPLA